MKKIPLLVLFVFLSACSNGMTSVSTNNQKEENNTTSENISSLDGKNITDEDSVFRGWYPLDNTGAEKFPLFLKSAGFSDLSDLDALGGKKKLTTALCKEIYAKFKESQRFQSSVSEEAGCDHNANADGTFEMNDASHTSPLYISVKEFDRSYLVLFIQEEGLGGTPLFTFVYDIPAGTTTAMDLTRIGYTDVYYKDDILYFTATGEIGGDVPPFPTMVATYDLRTKKLILDGQ